MTRKDKHPDIYTFLKDHPMGVLSTVDADHAPWGAAVYYLIDEDFTLYFVTRAESYKYQNIEVNPHVAMTVADSESQVTVQLSGEISTILVQKYMDIFFDKFAAIRPEGDYKWAPPVSLIHKGNYMPLQLTPTKMQYADYGKHRTEAHGNYIEQIIPAR